MREQDVPEWWNPREVGETRVEALNVLSDAFAWELADARWQEIYRILNAMAAAANSSDMEALAAATARLELAGPLRIIPIAVAGPPPPVRDLMNTLVHVLGGVTVDGSPPEPGDAGAADARFPRD